jgi:hypothetical protein
MPQGGRQPPKKAGSATAQSKAAEKDNWQRSSGAFSGAAKKDYLQWKRQQKAARAASSGNDEAVGRQQHPSSQKPSCWSANEGSLSADAAQPLRYRPLYAVPAEPFCVPAPSAHPLDHLTVTSTAGTGAAGSVSICLAGSNEPGAPVASTDGSGRAASVVYMPRLDPREVGFTPAGFQLDMPTRPQWQVRTRSLLCCCELDAIVAYCCSISCWTCPSCSTYMPLMHSTSAMQSSHRSL